MSLVSLTIEEYLARLASSDPTPGGGSLAALAGAMAAAMLAMTCNLTVGRPRYAAIEADVQTILADTALLRQRLLELADTDADAYLAVRDAYRLPRSSDVERAARDRSIEAAMHRATEVPVEGAETSRAVLDLALRAAGTTNVALLGDVAVAAHLALAAARGAADQAGLNLQQVTEAAFAASMRARLAGALAGADDVAARALQLVQTRSRRA
ncbi:MAG: hypothetical protein GEU73_03465 [Chloroflexi bacterium]|nr:hypothetical protein [Chloroflexota bacterium]